MDAFGRYLAELAAHEEEKTKPYLEEDPRRRLLVFAGARLNWIGDFLANPAVRWEERTIPVDDIGFTRTSPDWSAILVDQCGRSPTRFRNLVASDPAMREKFEREASSGDEPVLVRAGEAPFPYFVLDGMHRFVGNVLRGTKQVSALVPVNEKEVLPVCEAHVVYDLLRGYQRNAKDDAGAADLAASLRLLCRTYANVPDLLRNRFNATYVPDETVQRIITEVLRALP